MDRSKYYKQGQGVIVSKVRSIFASCYDVWINQKLCSGQFELRQSEYVNLNQKAGIAS